MADKAKKRFGAASLVVVALLTFIITTLIYYSRDINNPAYSISFDPDNVSYGNIQKINDIRDILSTAYYKEIDEDVLLEGMAEGMAYALDDPYTVYFNAEQMQLFLEEAEGSYSGIGVTVNMDTDGLLTVVEPFEGSPAIEAGMRQGDKIIGVNDEDVTGINDEYLIISKIKGPEGTMVKLTVYRPSEPLPVEMEIERRIIKIDNIKSRMLDAETGYIRIIKFDGEIYYYFEQKLNDLINQGMKSLIIDVRDNPGGSYDQVVAIIDRLIPEGLIVYTEDRDGNKEEESSDPQELGMPMAILINEYSASASEILAGAVRDSGTGILIGEKTFGKGLVQSLVKLDDGSGLKFTISTYFTPAGFCIHDIGIEPDIKVELSEQYKYFAVSQIPEAEDTQLSAAREALKEISLPVSSDSVPDAVPDAH